MSSKIKSFRTRCTNQRLLSPVSLKRTQPKYLGGGRRVSGRNMCSGDVHGVAPSQFVTPTATVLNHGAAPEVVSAAASRNTKRKVEIVPLEMEVREYLSTSEAAYHLCRKPQTLRVWSCTETGMLQPIGRGGRLMWPVAGIKALLLKDAEKAKSKAIAKDAAKKSDVVSNA